MKSVSRFADHLADDASEDVVAASRRGGGREEERDVRRLALAGLRLHDDDAVGRGRLLETERVGGPVERQLPR